MNRREPRGVMHMTRERMIEQLTKAQGNRQALAASIENATASLHAWDGRIQLLQELIAEETPAIVEETVASVNESAAP
jgi:chromosome segregation ATPase